MGSVDYDGPAWEVAEDTLTLPVDKEAEMAVLGSAMIDPDANMRLPTVIDEVDFFYSAHKIIYAVLVSLANRGQPAADYLLMIDELERLKELDNIGGPAYIVSLMANTPTAIYIDHYAGLVKRHAYARRAIAAGGEIVKVGYDSTLTNLDRTTKIEEIQRTYLSPPMLIDSLVTWNQSINEQIPRMEAQSDEVVNRNGFDWPFPTWNERLGDMPTGLVLQVLGDDGSGKTQLADLICEWWSKKRDKVGLYISTDMSREMTEARRLSRHSGILLDNLNTKKMTAEQWERVLQTQSDLSGWEGKIHYLYDPEMDIDAVCTAIHSAQIHHGIEYVILDNLNNFIDFPSLRQTRSNMTENQRVADNASRFIARIGKLGLRAVAINQLTKMGKAVTSVDDVSKNDVYGSGRQSNKIRLNLNLFRGYAEKDEYAPDGEILSRKGERSRFLHYKWTKVTNGSEFKGTLLMTPELYRMNDVKMQKVNIE